MMNPSRKTLNILVVEDNQADTEMIRIYLEESKMRHKLYSAQSLAEAFLQLDEHSIDLVLLDFGLPDSNGLNTLNSYLKRYDIIPVIVMTGLKDQRKGTESVRAGAQDYLVKGEFNSKQLVKVIRYSLERFRLNQITKEEAEQSSSENDKLHALHQMALISTWEMDIVTNEMKWSPELFQIFQLRPNQFPPSLSDYLNFVHREDKEAVEAFFTEAIKFEENGPIEHRIMIDNRLVKNISLRTRIKFDEKTNKVLLLGSVQDVTRYGKTPDDKEIVDEIEEEKIDTSDFINQISFNIRTPLSTLVHLIYLLEKTALNRQQKKLLLDLKTTIDDLSFTLSNLVNLSILSNDKLPLASEHFRPIDLLESIERVMVFKAQQNNREVDIYIDSRLAINVQGDSDKLGQLFFCMMELAFIHSEEGTFVKVRCTNGEEEEAKQNGTNSLLIVQLEYTGLLPEWPFDESELQTSTEDILDLIRPQERSQKSREHLLTVVFIRLCKQLNINCETNISNNAAFIDLEVPLKVGRQISDSIPEFPQKEVSILLVEDHPMHQIATKQILTTWSDKVEVTIAANGKIALAKVKEKTFDIILMDLQMPVMDGMAATVQLRQSIPTPIIALTASTSKQEEERCYQIGMNEYLAKPFQPEDLYRRIMLLIHEED